jgi:hypothetical protein
MPCQTALLVLDGQKHVAMVTAPDMFVEAITEFSWGREKPEPFATTPGKIINQHTEAHAQS